jgi:hypothetical protein
LRVRYPLTLALGTLLAGAAWVFLVRAAIDFGRAARGGGGLPGWLLTVAAAVGATMCLLLVFALLARVWDVLGLKQPHPSRRAGARRAR